MSFSVEKATQKLQAVDNTQQAIQSTSQWCLFHYRHAHEIVQIWENLFTMQLPTDANFKLSLFYLANDIVQVSKKKEDKYQVYLFEFEKIMDRIVRNISSDITSVHLKPKYSRVLNVWKDRSIYSIPYIIKLEKILSSKVPEKKEPVLVQTVSTADIDASLNDNTVIPTELAPLCLKYNKLNNLYRSYKDNFINFNKISTNLLKKDSSDNGSKNTINDTGESTQLSNLLSSLSALKGDGSLDVVVLEANEDKLKSQINKYHEVEKLGEKINQQLNDIKTLRFEISTNLKDLSKEIEDWIELDNTKKSKITSSLNILRERREMLQKEKSNNSQESRVKPSNDNKIIPQSVSVETEESNQIPTYTEYGEDDDTVPTYHDEGNNSDSDSDRVRHNDSDDSDDDFAEKEEETPVFEEESTNSNTSLLRKRLLGEGSDDDIDEESSDAKKRKINKSVSFAEDTKTLIFNKDESIKDQNPQTTTTVEMDLESLLGQLK